jgi:hypothetical protein
MLGVNLDYQTKHRNLPESHTVRAYILQILTPSHPSQFVVNVCLQGNELVRSSIEKLHNLHVNQSSRTLADSIEITTAQTS